MERPILKRTLIFSIVLSSCISLSYSYSKLSPLHHRIFNSNIRQQSSYSKISKLSYAKLDTITGDPIFPSILPPNLTSSTVTSSTYNNSTNPIESIGDSIYDGVNYLAKFISLPRGQNETKKFMPIQAALQKIQKDMEFLDDFAGRSPQLSSAEFAVLLTTVIVSGLSPVAFSAKVAELLVPSMAAISAAIGISAEYVGKVAVANGKETAALAIQATAESEVLLAQAERIKAVLPLCVGIATTASAFALLAPAFANEVIKKYAFVPVAEVYLFFPLVAVLAAAIAGLATQESMGLAAISIGTGNRRFASSGSVGRTWLSATEQILSSAKRVSNKWSSFALAVTPAPVIATLFPGPLSLRAIVCASIAAAQAAYYLAIAEYSIAEATNAVALKARAAAVADTYANQGSRSGAILPFTSGMQPLLSLTITAIHMIVLYYVCTYHALCKYHNIQHSQQSVATLFNYCYIYAYMILLDCLLGLVWLRIDFVYLISFDCIVGSYLIIHSFMCMCHSAGWSVCCCQCRSD